MRTIDADALKENAFGVYTQEHGHIEVVGVDAIDAAPTVEPKRGEWKWDNRHLYPKCSACEQYKKGTAVTNYCESCGADMRKEEK